MKFWQGKKERINKGETVDNYFELECVDSWVNALIAPASNNVNE